MLDPPIIQLQLGISAVIGALLTVYGLFGLPDIAPRSGGDDTVPLSSSDGDDSGNGEEEEEEAEVYIYIYIYQYH